jgi:chromosome segregation ATPase
MSTEREQDLAEHRARFHPMSERFRSSAHDFRAGHDAATARAQERIAVLEREVEKALQAYDAEVLGRRAEVQGCHAEMLTLRTANVAAERANATLAAELAELKRDCSCCIMNKERAVAAEARELTQKREAQAAKDTLNAVRAELDRLRESYAQWNERSMHIILCIESVLGVEPEVST